MKSEQDTYVVRKGLSPNTVSEISSKTKIYAKPAGEDGLVQVGVIASFDPSESRSIETIRGIGFGDKIAELVPGMTEAMTISVTRTAQYLSGMYQVFGYKGGVSGLVRSLRHHRWPFDIRKETVFSEIVSEKIDNSLTTSIASDGDERKEGGAQYKAVTTAFEGCWFQDWSTNYSSDTALVQENCSILVSDVYDGDNWDIYPLGVDTGNSGSSRRIVEL